MNPRAPLWLLISGCALSLAAIGHAMTLGSYALILVGLLIGMLAALTVVRAAVVYGALWAGAWTIMVLAYFNSYAHRGDFRLTMLLAVAGVAVALPGLFIVLAKLPRRELAPVVTMLVIGLLVAYFSGSKGSASGWEDVLMARFGWSREFASNVVHYARKCVHFTFYGSLGLSAASWGRRVSLELPRALWFGLAWTFVFGGFDEVRQSFHRDRTGSWSDLMIDCAGAACFLWLSTRFTALTKK